MHGCLIRPRDRTILFFSILVFVGSLSVGAQNSTAEGDERPQTLSLVMPVTVREAGTIEAPVRLTPEGNAVAVEWDAIEPLVATLVEGRRIAEVVGLESEDGFVTFPDLRSLGFVVRYNEEQVAVSIETPARLREVRTIPIRPSRTIPADYIERADVSGYLNLAVASGFQTEAGVLAVPVSVEVEPVVSILGVVAEAQLSYRYDGGHIFEIDDVRLTYDDRDHKLRATAGEVHYQPAPFGSAPTMWGLAVSRLPGLYELETVPIPAAVDFLVDEDSDVRFSLNGKVLDETSLGRGRYRVINFPLGSGINEITVRGAGDPIVVNYPYDARLLPAGEYEFSYAFGLRDANPASIVASIRHGIGLTPQLTISTGLQADFSTVHAGAGALWATDIGTFGLDVGGGHFGGSGFDGAVRFGYQLAYLPQPFLPVVGANVQYLGPAFTPLVSDAENTFPWTFSASVAQALPAGMSVNLNGRLRASFSRDVFVPEIRVSLRAPLPERTTLTGRLGIVFGGDGNPEFSGTITLSSAAVRQTTVTVRHDFSDATENVSAFYSPQLNVGALSVGLGISGMPFTTSEDGRFSFRSFYRNPRVQTNAAYEMWSAPEEPDSPAPNGPAPDGPGPDGAAANHRLLVDAATALVFAGGYFGWSRPIQNSFALIVPQEELSNDVFLVDQVGDTHAGSTAILNHAVVPNLGLHTPRRVEVIGPDLELGRQLDQTEFDLLSGYRTGTLIRITSDSRVFVSGRFVDSDGKPLSLRAGYVLSEGDPDVRIEYFTNRAGEFYIYGLAPGNYELYLSGMDEIGVFGIGREESGEVDLGDVELGQTEEDSP